MPVVYEDNLKNRNMYNAQVFRITEIDSNFVLVNGQTFIHSVLAKYFNLAFGMTVHKYQGGTINEPFCIHNANVMGKKELYSALSRTAKYEYLHIGRTGSIYSVKEKKVLEMTPFKTEYHTGKIYYNEFMKDGVQQLYIGFTVNTLEKRLTEHQSDKRSPIYQCQATINLICNAPCRDKGELETIENKYINMYPNCVNVRGRVKEKNPSNLVTVLLIWTKKS